MQTTFINGTVILPDRLLSDHVVVVHDGIIVEIRATIPTAAKQVDLRGNFLSPGWVDLHVHGGGGSDFMDLTPDAFRTVCQTHARHGTTSLSPTSTVATQAEYEEFLRLCLSFLGQPTGGARVVGAHLYGPYFLPAAKGCHPTAEFLRPDQSQVPIDARYDATFPLTVTLAPELPGAIELIRESVARGARVNIGHSYATLEQVENAVNAGARHVDHLFCAMSDRARLRLTQAFPMRAGVAEATLMMDQLTTEVIADGSHLADSLLRVAYQLKGAERLALVTDTMRAVDCPDGEYWFGPVNTGERIRRLGDVGVTMKGDALASAVMGMDHAVRTMARATRASLPEVIRMASLTPATILGLESDLGSIAVGKVADFCVLNPELQLQAVYVDGELIAGSE